MLHPRRYKLLCAFGARSLELGVMLYHFLRIFIISKKENTILYLQF